METITPDKRKYNRLSGKLATMEAELRKVRKLLEAPAKSGWRRWLWGMGAKTAVALVVGFLLSGCLATVSEIRGKEPSRTITSTKTPQELSKCIEFAIREKHGGPWIVNREEYPNNVYRVVLTATMSAIADILVKPTDGGSVVEFRQAYGESGDYGWYQILEFIERCAK